MNNLVIDVKTLELETLQNLKNSKASNTLRAYKADYKDFARFLQITLGSAFEIETQLLIASDLKFISDEDLESLLNELNSIIKMTSKFNTSLRLFMSILSSSDLSWNHSLTCH